MIDMHQIGIAYILGLVLGLASDSGSAGRLKGVTQKTPAPHRMSMRREQQPVSPSSQHSNAAKQGHGL